MSSQDNETPEQAPESTEQPNPSTSSVPPKDRRFKLSRACDRCRHRRIKCDEGHPCQPCLGAKTDCTFEQTAKRSSAHKTKKTFMLEARMRQLESIIEAIPPQTLAAIQAGIYTDESSGVSGPWAIVHSPRLSETTRFEVPSATHAGQDYPHHSEPVYRGLPHVLDTAAGPSMAPSSKFFVDDQGDTQWHGSTSGLPLLEMLVHAHGYQFTSGAQYGRDSAPDVAGDVSPHGTTSPSSGPSSSISPSSGVTPSRVVIGSWDDETTFASSDYSEDGLGITWSTISSAIPAELMDELVRAFLSTSYYLYPFLHLPSFLNDYSTPEKWSDTGFASFIVSLCCLSSLHTDNAALRANSSVVTKWFELFLHLRTLPGAERPTLYAIQGAFIGAVFAFGKGMMSKGVALLAEASTRAVEAGLHRTADSYDWFDPIQDQVRKRTFWCIYLWDKHASAQFGRHPTLRLRDCDIDLPALVNDEQITFDNLNLQSSSTDTLMGAFCCNCQLGVVLDGVLDTPPSRTYTDRPGSFLSRATAIFSGTKQNSDLFAEEALLDEAVKAIPAHWSYTSDTLASGDVVRISQAERLHCFESYIRMLIHRRRFSVRAAERIDRGIEGPQTEEERNAIRGVHAAASEIVAVHQNAVNRGLVTYYGIHNVHQLIQVSRSTVAVTLEARMDPTLRQLLPSMVDNIRTAFMLCRHFGEVYPDGMRASDMMEEICFLTQIPLGIPAHMSRANTNPNRKKYVNHIRKRPTARGVGSPLAIRSNLDLFKPNTSPFSALSPSSSDVLPNISAFSSSLNTPNDSPSSFKAGPL